MPVQMQPVKSSNIAAVGYDPDGQTLHVAFNTGSTYTHSDVTPEMHAAFISASSVGSHYHQHFRGNKAHPASKLERESSP